MEKRLAPRRNTSIVAQITYGGQEQYCIIRNVSDTGAKLELKSVGQVPNSFQLRAPGYQPHACQIVWRAMREVGVQFLAR